jgi:hypothetical protein
VDPADSDIDSLFYNWNKAILHSLQEGMEHARIADEKALFANRLEGQPIFWPIEIDDLNKESIRWKFLEHIEKDLNWKNRNWTVIEVKKSGERVILQNHLLCYDNSGAKIITYRWFYNVWKKIGESHAIFKMNDLALKKARVPFNSGKNNYDVIVTNFKSEVVLQSEYFLEGTLSDKSKIADIIN